MDLFHPRLSPRTSAHLLRHAVLAAVVAVSAPPRGTAAQMQPPDSGAMVLERVTRDRWIPEDRDPAFVPFTEATEAIRLWLLPTGRITTDTRYLLLRLARFQADLGIDRRNHLHDISLDPPAVHYTRWDDAEARAAHRLWQLHGPGALLGLPESRFVAVLFPVPDEPLAPGTRWTDTLTFAAEAAAGLSETLEEVRHNQVVGDTLLDGRRLPVVRTTSEVRYTATSAPSRISTYQGAKLDHDLRGGAHGVVIVDTAMGVRAGGADTTTWEGSALLHDPDGRSYPSAVRYERLRRWSLRDSASWADSVRANDPRRSGGMLAFPPDSLAARIARGDTTAIDSLLTLWRTADDVTARQRAERSLEVWSRSELSRALDDLRLQAGDTAGALDAFLSRWRHRLRPSDLEVFRPWLDDPGRLWRNGFQPSPTYESLAQVIRNASPLVEPDSARWRCEPTACRRLVAMHDSVETPGLADATLVLAFARDPARWQTTLRERARAGSHIARESLPLADGVGAPWPASPQDPMPPAGADWRSWLSWMGGTVRFENTHAAALRVYAAERGRDPVDELARGWPPESDSAQLVLGTILEGMGRLERSPEAVAQELLSGSPERIRLAQATLRRHLGRGAAHAAPEVAREILPPLIDSMLAQGEAPWPRVPGLVFGVGRSLFSSVPQLPLPRFLIRDGLPADVVAQVRPPVLVVDSATWAARPVRAGGVVLTVDPPRAWGDFVSVRWDWTAFHPHAPDEPPSGYAGGGSVDLLRTEEGWRVVGAGLWIT